MFEEEKKHPACLYAYIYTDSSNYVQINLIVIFITLIILTDTNPILIVIIILLQIRIPPHTSMAVCAQGRGCEGW